MTTFTPKIIKNDEEYEAMLARIEEIFHAETGTPEYDEMELLVNLVEKYEDEKYPIEAPDPITAIKFRMEQQGLKNKDLIPYIGNKSKVSEVLSGKRNLSLNMIRKLHDGLEIPLESLIKEPEKKLPNSDIMKHGVNFPFTEMFNRKWFKPYFNGTLSQAKEMKEEILIDFIHPFKIQDFTASYNRKSETEITNIDDIILAWRIRVMKQALKENLPVWNREILSEKFFSGLVSLSYLKEGPKLAKEFLNKAGIHLIIENHLEKTRLDGSSMLMPNGNPLIALTLRYDRLDSFWFTLFHELAHIKLHLTEKNNAFFDDMNNEMSKQIEAEADNFAQQMLISHEVWKEANLNQYSEAEDIICFADLQRISPSIPAGRLRHETKNYKKFTNLVGNGTVRKMFAEDFNC